MSFLHFIIPDPQDFPSGGNAFNRELIAALIRAGLHVSHKPFHPDMTPASPQTQYFLDSIYFEQITRPDHQLPPRCIGLVHHLDSLYPRSEDCFVTREKPLLDRFSGFLVTSPFTCAYLIAHGYAADRIMTIPPAPLQSPFTDRVPAHKVHALIIGNLIPRKGILPFLQALQAAEVPPYYTLTIAGSTTVDPHYTRACMDIILTDASLQKCVKIAGVQDQAGIDALYRKSTLCISSALMETFGMAIQDAVVSGLPLLVHPGGYAEEHVHPGVNGLVCNDHAALVAQFKMLIMHTESFISLQEGAIRFSHPYHSWDDAARILTGAIAGWSA
jgi:glycosyltransferase involved in cell wall biosynthesis